MDKFREFKIKGIEGTRDTLEEKSTNDRVLTCMDNNYP